MNWQPMSTAPKDQPGIIASDLDSIDFIWWDSNEECWRNRECDYFFPFAWMPMPDHPPETLIASMSLIHEGGDTKTLDEAFDRWWWHEGSGELPLPGHDHEEHAHRIARIAWHNGAYCQKYQKQ